MHTVWKGAISFGLVHVPVKMFSATEDKDISLRMLHSVCGSPIAYVRECPVCDKRVEWDEIIKGYEYEKGRFVTFDKEELDEIAGEKSKTIRILDFVALEEIDPIYFQKTYYLSPDQAGGGAYTLLMEAMKESGKIGIANISIRSKSSLAAIRVLEGCLAMETIYYPDEIRPIEQVPGLPGAVQLNDKELTMAKLLIEQLTAPFEPEKYTDEYRSAMHDLIQRENRRRGCARRPSAGARPYAGSDGGSAGEPGIGQGSASVAGAGHRSGFVFGAGIRLDEGFSAGLSNSSFEERAIRTKRNHLKRRLSRARRKIKSLERADAEREKPLAGSEGTCTEREEISSGEHRKPDGPHLPGETAGRSRLGSSDQVGRRPSAGANRPERRQHCTALLSPGVAQEQHLSRAARSPAEHRSLTWVPACSTGS